MSNALVPFNSVERTSAFELFDVEQSAEIEFCRFELNGGLVNTVWEYSEEE